MNTLSNSQVPDASVSLIPHFIWKYKVFIICFTAFFSGLMVLYAISKPNVYTAQGLYMPKGGEEGGSLAKLAGQFGGLASMAGVNLGGGGGDKTDVALELLKSRAFLQAFIEKHDLVMPLLAVEKWDKSSNRLIIDPELYNEETSTWIREVPKGKNAEPSSWEAFSELNNNIAINYASKKGTLSIKLTYYSPEIAAKWLALLVNDMNLFWKEKTQKETEKYIQLLEQEAEKQHPTELKAVLYGLIGEQTKTLLLNNITDEVMFETVTPIIVPEEKSAPSRALLCIVAVIFSFIFSSFISVLFGLNRLSKSKHSC
jgi:uncharacterized protein involved in exopolysaccharide biosynthesis